MIVERVRCGGEGELGAALSAEHRHRHDGLDGGSAWELQRVEQRAEDGRNGQYRRRVRDNAALVWDARAHPDHIRPEWLRLGRPFGGGIGLLAQGRAGLSSRPSCARCVRGRRRVHTTGDARGGGSGRAGSSTASRRERFSSLSPRELKVASLVAEGLSSVEIAKRLTIEAASVRRTVSRVLAKLGMRDRVQIAVAWWRK